MYPLVQVNFGEPAFLWQSGAREEKKQGNKKKPGKGQPSHAQDLPFQHLAKLGSTLQD